LKEEDVRKQLLKYFQQYDASTGAKQTVSGAFKDLNYLTNKLEGYTFTPIEVKGQALMLQIGSKSCEKSCIFVFLGVFEEWEKEQETCYMLSRLGRSWKGLWLFDAIVRPDQCLEEIKKFLWQKGVVGEQERDTRENMEERRIGEEQTKWAHLEFEDGQIVPLKNSVSTSFYIGREPSTKEHNHQFHHEDGNLCRRISRAHCQIRRLDTGSFSSYILSSKPVLLILMKYVN
jgi:hypothetical protein